MEKKIVLLYIDIQNEKAFVRKISKEDRRLNKMERALSLSIEVNIDTIENVFSD